MSTVAVHNSMKIEHRPELSRFEYASGGDLAVCDYLREGSVWTLTHTFVPETLRGGGVAAALVKTALDHIRAENGRVVPACSYVAAYIQRHPGYASLLQPA